MLSTNCPPPVYLRSTICPFTAKKSDVILIMNQEKARRKNLNFLVHSFAKENA